MLHCIPMQAGSRVLLPPIRRGNNTGRVLLCGGAGAPACAATRAQYAPVILKALCNCAQRPDSTAKTAKSGANDFRITDMRSMTWRACKALMPACNKTYACLQ
jgi:hypothetical protein